MEFLFRSRGAGKRQVKPSQDIDMLTNQLAAGGNQGGFDGSSDDSDFKLEKSSDNSSDGEDGSESDTDSEVSSIHDIGMYFRENCRNPPF